MSHSWPTWTITWTNLFRPDFHLHLTRLRYKCTPLHHLRIIFDNKKPCPCQPDHFYTYIFINLHQFNPTLDYKSACLIATLLVHSKLDYCIFLSYKIDSSQKAFPTNSSEHFCSCSRQNTQIPKKHPRTFSNQFWLTVIDYKILSLTYNVLQNSQLLQSPDFPIQLPNYPTRSSSYFSLSLPPISFDLIFCNCFLIYATAALCNELQKVLCHYSPFLHVNLSTALTPAPSHSRPTDELSR